MEVMVKIKKERSTSQDAGGKRVAGDSADHFHFQVAHSGIPEIASSLYFDTVSSPIPAL